jgi:hypothetical protein
VRQLTDPSGAVNLAKNYRPYGDLLSSAGNADTPNDFAGECGCDMQAQALSMTKGEWTRAHAVSGAIFGGIAAPIATVAPIGMIAVGTGGLILSGADLIRTVNVVQNETGWTKCTGTRFAIDVVGALGSTAGIVKGAQAWHRSGSPFQWKYPAIIPPTNRAGLRSAMDAPPSNMVNPQAHHDLPWTYREWFAGEGRGLNVNDPAYGRWVEGTPPGPHQMWSNDYELEWMTFKSNNPNANKLQVLNFLEKLLSSGRFPSR